MDGAAAVAPAEQPVAAPLEAAEAVLEAAEAVIEEPEEVREIAAEEATGARRRRRRGRRGRGRRDADEITDAVEAPDSTPAGETPAGDEGTPDEDAESPDTAEAGTSTASRRRRRRRRKAGDNGDEAAGRSEDDPPDTVVHVRDNRAREAEDDNGDGVRGVRGSTRLEAKRQRRREGRDSGRRRAPILTEAEFLARREAVDRTMAVRDLGDRTQIAVLEDGVLVEHYVTRASADLLRGQRLPGSGANVLPSMEAAFVDIGKGRNGVLYAGEVNWDAAGLEGKAARYRERPEVGRHDPGAGDQGPGGPQGRPADEPDLLAGPVPRLCSPRWHDRDQPQAAGHRAAPVEVDPEEDRARRRRGDHSHRGRGRHRRGTHA